MKAEDIAIIAVKRSNSPFFLRANQCVVRNVSWGLFSWGEADIIALTKSFYLIEGEIKISKSDLLADRKKLKFLHERTTIDHSHWKQDIKAFYYIVPTAIVEQAMLLSYGVIEVDGDKLKVHRKSPIHKEAKKLPDKQVYNLMRLGCMKAWR